MDREAMMQMMMKKFHAAENHEPGFRPETPYAASFSEAVEKTKDCADAWAWAEEMYTEYQADKQQGSVNPAAAFVPEKRPEEYRLTTKAKPRGDEPDYLDYPTRSLDTLKGYVGREAPQPDKWQGDASRQLEATGFYRMETVAGRNTWIDPEGHPVYMAGISAVRTTTSPNTEKNALEKFGSKEAWADHTAERLKDLGFAAAGMWSEMEALHGAGKHLGLFGTCYFVTEYARSKGLTEPGVGHELFRNNNTLPVFDPDFEAFADTYARERCAPWKDCPDICGWFSDNELPTMLNFLERYLTVEPDNPTAVYSLAAAWTYLKNASGRENPALSDVTKDMLEDFRGMVFNRYYRVVSTAMKRHDPNHLYVGSRFSYLGKIYQEGTQLNESILRAAGRFCDVVSVNYYFAWEPDAEVVKKWHDWMGKPFMVTEWYAMSTDSGLKCMTGAGFKVPGQKERAAFYQNFALWLMECPFCAGFHWFMYMDNDPGDANAEASNINGNKGIVTIHYDEWTALTASMQRLNRQIPNLVAWFDQRNNIQ